MNEVWKDVAEYEKYYEVSTFGNVRSKSSSKILKPKIDKRGRAVVRLKCHKLNKHYNYPVYKLVINAFWNKPLTYDKIIHVDGDMLNNKVNNLEFSMGDMYRQSVKESRFMMENLKSIIECLNK